MLEKQKGPHLAGPLRVSVCCSRLHAGPSAVAVIGIGVVVQDRCSHDTTRREGGFTGEVVGKAGVHGAD